ncbi:hypothetical protein OQA88_3643 [Cercophora sp. LCS_1]
MTPRPLFYLQRLGPNGSITALVPLIALDELPDWVEVAGLPRYLTPEQTDGLVNLGVYANLEGAYPVCIRYAPPPDPSWADEVRETDNQQAQEASPVLSYDTSLARNRDGTDTPATNRQGPTPGSAILAPASTPQPQMAVPMHPAERMKAHYERPHVGLQGSIHNRPSDIPTAQTNGCLVKTHITNTPMTATIQPTTPSQPPNTPDSVTTTPTDAPPKISQHISSQPSNISHPTAPTPASALVLNDPIQREYCRNWVRERQCRFTPNCRNIHAVPDDPAILSEIFNYKTNKKLKNNSNTINVKERAIKGHHKGETDRALAQLKAEARFHSQVLPSAHTQRLPLAQQRGNIPGSGGKGTGGTGTGGLGIIGRGVSPLEKRRVGTPAVNQNGKGAGNGCAVGMQRGASVQQHSVGIQGTQESGKAQGGHMKEVTKEQSIVELLIDFGTETV